MRDIDLTDSPVFDEGLIHDDLRKCFVDQSSGNVETVLEVLLVVVVHGFLDHSMDGVNTVVSLDEFPLQ